MNTRIHITHSLGGAGRYMRLSFLLLVLLLLLSSGEICFRSVHAQTYLCLGSVDIYLINSQFVPSSSADLSLLPPGVSEPLRINGPASWGAFGAQTVEVPKNTRRVAMRFIFNETDCHEAGGAFFGPLPLTDAMSGRQIHNGEFYYLPYELSPTINGISPAYSFDTALGSFVVNFLVAGFSLLDSNTQLPLVIIPGIPVRAPITLEGYTPLHAPMTFDLTATGGVHLDQTQITFVAGSVFGSAWPPQLIISAPYTGPQAQTVLITGKRNYTVSPLLFASDEDHYGSSFVFTVQVVPNGVCKSDGGHLQLGGATNSSSLKWTAGAPSFQSSTTTCFWWRPDIANENTQVWIAFGLLASQGLLYGICGSDLFVAGCPSGAIFMWDRQYGNIFWALPPGSLDGLNPGASFNWKVWQHVCFINHNDAMMPYQHFMQIFVNGLEAAAPHPVGSSWYSFLPNGLTVGATFDSLYPASGALDELYVYMTYLESLDIWNSYRTQDWPNVPSVASAPYYWSFDGGVYNYVDLQPVQTTSGAYVSLTVGDAKCTALAPPVGTLGNASSATCMQPFRYSNIPYQGIGTSVHLDGALGIGLGGTVTTGGSDWSGQVNVSLSSNAFLVCTWVNRFYKMANTPQTIFSLGTPYQSGAGLFSFSYFNDGVRVNFGSETLEGNIDIPLDWDSDGTYSNDDQKKWIHWCLTVTPSGSDFEYQPNPYFQLYRNGRWWYRGELNSTFQSMTPTPVNPNGDNYVCLGCIFNTSITLRYPLFGALDEFRMHALPTVSAFGGFDAIITKAFRTDQWGPYLTNGAIVYFKFDDMSGPQIKSTIWDSPSMTTVYNSYFTNYSGLAEPSFIGGQASTSPVSYTCLTIGQPFHQDPADSALGNILPFQLGSQHPFSQNNSGSAQIEWIEISSPIDSLSLAAHSQVFANHDFSVCYWTRRDPTMNDFTSTSWTHYDVSIGNPSMWIGQYVDGLTQYWTFSFATNNSLSVSNYGLQVSYDVSFWVHICGTYASVGQHGAGNAIRKLYRNGQLLGQDFPTADLTSNSPIAIGQKADGTAFSPSSKHDYDEVTIFTTTLTTSEIVTYFNTQAFTSVPVFQWTFQHDSYVAGVHGFTSTVGSDIIVCLNFCSYKSWLTSVISDATRAPAIQLIAPMVCPLDYHSDGSLLITSQNYDISTGQASLNTGSGPLVITSPPTAPGETAPFNDTDFGFSIWVKLTARESVPNRPYTIFEFGCGNNTNKLWIDSLNTPGITPNISFSASGLTATSSSVNVGQVGVWMQLVGSYSGLAGVVNLYISAGVVYTNTDIVINRRLFCSNGVNATLGSFFNYTNFNGFVDEFKVYNNIIDNTPDDLAYQFSLYSGNHYMQRVNAVRQAQHLQLYLNFAEQQGQLIHSSHPITPSSNISWTIASKVSTAEPIWFGAGLTTFFGGAYETNTTNPLLSGGVISAAEGSILCTPSALESPIMVQSDTITQLNGLLVGMEAEVSLSWLQTLGPQGLTVTIVALGTGVTVTPNTIDYPAGGGGYLISSLPTTFNVTATQPQYVTLKFLFSGPEAVHLSPYLNRPPALTFTAFNDIASVDFYCYFTYVDANGTIVSTPAYTAFPYQTDVFHTAASLAFNGTQTQINYCGFKITRSSSALTSIVNVVTPDGSMLSSPLGGFTVWQPEFYLPIGSFTVSVISPTDPIQSLSIARIKVNPWQVTATSTPASNNVTQGQVTEIVIWTPTLYNNITITPLVSDPSVVITPPDVTVQGPGLSSTAVFYMTIPVQHPAISSFTISYTASGLGADEADAPFDQVFFNSYQLTGDALDSISFVLATGPRFDLDLINTGVSASGAYDVTLPLSDTSVSVEINFDQSLYELGYLFEALTTDLSLPSNTSAAIDFTPLIGTFLSFNLPSMPVGSHVLFMQSKSTDRNNRQLFTFSITVEAPIVSAQLVCNSPSDLTITPDIIALALTLNSLQSVQLNNYACAVNLVVLLSGATLFVRVDQVTTLTFGPDPTATISTNPFQLTNGVPSSLEFAFTTGQSYLYNLTYLDTSNGGPTILPPTAVDGTCDGASNLCQYGSECVPADTTTTNKTAPDCLCSPQFRGPLCQFAVLDCPDCVIPAAPTNVSIHTYANLTLVGLGFDRIENIHVGGLTIRPKQFAAFGSLFANDTLVENALSSGSFDSSLYEMDQGFYYLRLLVDVGKVGNFSSQARLNRFEVQSTKSGKTHHSSTMFVSTGGSGYVPVTFDLIYSAPVYASYDVLVYQSIYATCLESGEWKPDPEDPSICLDCPEGGNCPGGGLVYPEPGYWSANEYSAPVACELGVDQCPGTDPSALTTLDATGHVNTQVCGVGYTGTACGSCAEHYYQTSRRCSPCSSSASESAQLAGLLLLGVAVLGFLSLAVAIASSEWLATIVALFVLLQQTIATGKASSQTWSGSLKSLSDLLNTLGIVNFDLTFLKPGCIAPTYSFIDTFYGTLLFAFIAFVMFQLACWLRKKYLLVQLSRRAKAAAEKSADAELYGHNDLHPNQTPEEKKKKGVLDADERKKQENEIELGYKRRIRHATFILGSLFYLKLTTLELNGLNCHQVPRSTTLDASSDASAVDPNDMIYVLMSDATTECWTGVHAGTVVIIVFLLVFFSFSFPLYCMVVLTRAFAPIVLLNHSSSWIGKLLFKLGYVRIQTTEKDGRPKPLERVNSLDGATQLESVVKHTAAGSEEKQLQKLHHIHMELFGYLFRGVKNERYFFRLLSFPVSLGFTLTLVFVTDVVKRTFILGLLYSFNSIIHCFFIPFLVWRENVISSGIQLASLVYTIGVLALMKGDNVNNFTMILGFVAIVVCIQYVLFIILKRPASTNYQVKKLSSDSDTADVVVDGNDDGRFDRNGPVSSIPPDDSPKDVELVQIRSPSNQQRSSSSSSSNHPRVKLFTASSSIRPPSAGKEPTTDQNVNTINPPPTDVQEQMTVTDVGVTDLETIPDAGVGGITGGPVAGSGLDIPGGPPSSYPLLHDQSGPFR